MAKLKSWMTMGLAFAAVFVVYTLFAFPTQRAPPSLIKARVWAHDHLYDHSVDDSSSNLKPVTAARISSKISLLSAQLQRITSQLQTLKADLDSVSSSEHRELPSPTQDTAVASPPPSNPPADTTAQGATNADIGKDAKLASVEEKHSQESEEQRSQEQPSQPAADANAGKHSHARQTKVTLDELGNYIPVLNENNEEPDWTAFRSLGDKQFEAIRALRHLRKSQWGTLSPWDRVRLNTEGFQYPLVGKLGEFRPRDQWTEEEKKHIHDTWKDVDVSKPIVVLLKTGHMFGSGYTGHKKCELPDGRQFKCLFTSDKKYEETADALWYHGPGTSVPQMRSGRQNPRQRIVVMSMESEINYPVVARATKEFDKISERLEDKSLHPITMNYRVDTDVPTVYAFFNKETKPVPVHEKLNKAIYMQSNCVATRDNYVRELMKHFPVDARGRCLNNAPEKIPRSRYNQNIDVYSQYKFSLCMENTVGDYYTTERVFHALEAGSVPVYFGAPNADMYLPPGGVIFAADYPNPEDLAKYLQKLADNNDLYNEYTLWRQTDIGIGLRRMISLGQEPHNPECRLCLKLLHQCDRTCTCGGKQVDATKFYDKQPWNLLQQLRENAEKK